MTEARRPIAWIDSIEASEAEGRLAELYARMVDPVSGEVDNVLRVHSLEPAGLEAHWQLYRSVMRGTRTLRTRDRELIAVVVSKLNGCHY